MAQLTNVGTGNFGADASRADAQPSVNPALAPGATLSQRIRNYGDIPRHVRLVSRAKDGNGIGVWTVQEITYSSYINGSPAPGATTTVGATSTIGEGELNGRWIASSV